MLLDERFAKAYETFDRAVDVVDRSVMTAADPSSGEQWDLTHVLGHASEMLEFWLVEVLRVLAHGPDEPFGRLKTSTERIDRIENSAKLSVEELRHQINMGAAATVDLCRILTPDQVERRGIHPKFGPLSVEAILKEFGVNHLVEYAEQLVGAL